MSFSEYCQAIEAAHSSGRATEHSYRPALAGLLARVGGAEIDAVNEPTHADYGALDFILLRRGVPLGHIECKGVGRSLDNIEDSKQFVRYRETLPNLLLTDYLKFCSL